MKKLWNEYGELWRKMPGAMIILHFTVTGGTIVVILLAQGMIIGLVTLIVWLLILAIIAKPCLMMNLMRDD